MGFEDFQRCCQERGLQDVSPLEHAGQDMVSWVIQAWATLPTWAKTALEYAGNELGDAAAALGWQPAAASILGTIAGGGIAVGIDVLASCFAQW